MNRIAGKLLTIVLVAAGCASPVVIAEGPPDAGEPTREWVTTNGPADTRLQLLGVALGRAYATDGNAYVGDLAFYRSDAEGRNFEALPNSGIAGTQAGKPVAVIEFRNRAWLATDTRLYWSEDGETFYQHPEPMSRHYPSAMAVISNMLWILGSDTIRTTDGETFHGVDAIGGLSSLVRIGDVLIGGNGSGAGVFRSTDGGETWERPMLGNSEFRRVLAMIAQDGYVYAGTDDGLYRSYDEGASWSKGAGDVLVSFAPFGDGMLALDATGRVFRSEWNGRTFVPRDPGPIPGAPQRIDAIGEAVVAGLDASGLWRLASGGGWENVSPPTSTPAVLHATEDDVIAALPGTTASYRANDALDRWTAYAQGLGPTYGSITTLAGDADEVWAGTSLASVLRSRDGGRSWEVVRENLEVEGEIRNDVSGISIHGDELVAGIAGTGINGGSFGVPAGGGLFRSTDHGATWKPIHGELPVRTIDGYDGLPGIQAVVHAADGAIVASVDAETIGVFRSADGGASWTKAAGLPTPANSGESVIRLVRAGDAIVGLADGRAYVSTNGGGRFERVTFGASEDLTITALGTDGMYVFAGSASGVFASADGGVTGVEIGRAIRGKKVVSLAARPGLVVAGVADGGVWAWK